MKAAVWALLLVNLLYGINYGVAKSIMPEPLHPTGIIFMRSAGALLLFWIVALSRPIERIQKGDWLRLLLCALFGVMLNQTLFFEGLNRSNPIESALVMTVSPVLVFLFSAQAGLEKLQKTTWAGILLSGGGAAALILHRQEGMVFSQSSGFGNLLIFINAASFALFLVLVKPLMQKYSPITVMAWVFTFGMPMTAVLGIPDLAATPLLEIPAGVWWAVAYVVVGVTFLAYLLNVFALKRVNASLVSAFIYLQPVVAGMLQAFGGKLDFSWTLAWSCAAVCIGLFLVGRASK
jgi:drug/metabolite transporter (DMT)-like permease